jgi:1-deoxy-D-xylulose-5-phosphate synthase
MILEDIKDPSFLKELTIPELNELASDIRSFLIQSISKTGGHLASNLGVVELTIALHYVFNSPQDKIFFDVGHQSYTHKILTGRAKDFPKLRQYRGLSGFEKRSESKHDVWEAGHSSTTLSAALGMAVSRDLLHQNYHIVPVIGDGALGSGMALEALNSIGSEKRNIIIIFNDNNMSISKNVGALSKGFAQLRSNPGYNDLKKNMKHFLNKNELGKHVYEGMKYMKDSVKENVIDRGIFGEFNLEYMGPVDGHNIHDLIQVLNVAKEHEGPVVVHVITKKGKGYGPCEKDREGIWHGVGPFNIETGKQLKETAVGYMSWSKVASEAVCELAEKDKRIVCLTPAMINGSKLENFFSKYPERSFDCGIAEEHTITFAAGLAISGTRPFVSIYSSFMQRAYDQINHDVCRMDLPVVLGIDRSGIVGEDGDTHHGVFDIGLLRPLPHMILAEPKDASEARNLFYTAFNQEHPFAIRYPRGEIKESKEKMELIPVGKWAMYHDNPTNKVAILAYGPDVDRILSKIENNDLAVTVINCRYLKPFDTDMLDELAARNISLIIYETDMLVGGIGDGILSYYNSKKENVSITRIGIKDNYVSQGSVKLLREEQHIDLNTLFDKVLALLKEYD